jgi:hypothetical protein
MTGRLQHLIQKESISYTLYSEYLSAMGYLDGEASKIMYVRHQDVRDAVMALMEVLLCGYENEIFSQICRDYQANTRLCQKQSLLLKRYEHMGNIISCHIVDDIVSLTTHHTLSQKKEPFSMALKDNDKLRETLRKVTIEVLQILGRKASLQEAH